MTARWKCMIIATMVASATVSRCKADVDLVARVCDPLASGCWELAPILRPEQFLIPVTPIPVPLPPVPECTSCPPFIEIYDIPNLDILNFEPPPGFQAQLRLFGDPSPQPNIVDRLDLPNLLLIYNGANQIAGPAELAPFELQLPPHITRLQFFSQAFNAQGAPVSNIGFIQVPEPETALLLFGGIAMAWGVVWRRRGAIHFGRRYARYPSHCSADIQCSA